MFNPNIFFDLEKFSHQEVFVTNKPIWETIKNLKFYLKKSIFGRIECHVPSSVTLVNPDQISIGKNSIIEPNSYIEGPCVIGERCQIRHGSYIRPFVLTGNRCVIGHGSEIKHSILLDGATASHFNYVGDSILGNSVNIGAGVICANFRLDHGEIIVEKTIKTGLNKMGAIIGDGSQIGCNSVTNPGVLLQKKTFLFPCTSVKKSNIKIGNNDGNQKFQ